MRKLIYVSSPFAGNMKENKQLARIYAKTVIDQGHIPIVPHLYITEILDDTIPEQRQQGMSLCLDLVDRADEIWFFGPLSKGMKMEYDKAIELGKNIKSFPAYHN